MEKVLKQRIITGVVLGLLAVMLLFFIPQKLFVIATGAIMLLAAWEWTRLADMQTTCARYFFLGTVLVGMFVVDWIIPVRLLLWLAFFFWIFALYAVFRYPQSTYLWSSKLKRFVMGLCVLLPCWLAVNHIHGLSQGSWILLFMMVLVWSADIGAYFVGRQFGRHKLMSHVSPGKTWEGFAGGLLLSLIVAIIGGFLIGKAGWTWPMLGLMVVLLNVFAVTGDLFESMLKRHMNMKDSGNILPGHGGILDRLDSLMAVAPFFLLALTLYGHVL